MLKNFLLVLTSTALTLIICAVLFELVATFRYDAWREEFVEKGGLYGTLTVASDNDVLVWEYRPDATAETWNTTIDTNNFGFRDRNWSLEKPPDTLRIAFAGDSVALGLGVDAEEAFIRQFEKKIAASTPRVNVEAMSFAVGGYSALQVAELIREKVVRFAPDIVVYVMCMNDFDFVHASGQIMKYFRKPENFFLRFVERTYAKFFVDHYYEYHFAKTRDTVFDELYQLKAELDAQGIELVVATMPIFDGDDSGENYPISTMHTEILDALRERNIRVIDFRGTFDNHDAPRQSYAFDDVHLTAEAHELAAQKFARELLRSHETPE